MKYKASLYKKFGYLGLATFTFLLVDSLIYIKAGISDWRIYTRLIIGIGGLLIDGYLVFFYRQKQSNTAEDKRRSFTLIELLVVLAIIGTLSTTVVVSVTPMRQAARDLERAVDMEKVKLALETYYDMNEQYPTGDGDGADGWDVGNQNLPFLTQNNVSELGNVMPDPPRDSTASGNDSGYKYKLYNAGENGCDINKGRYYVLVVKQMESKNPPTGPGWKCGYKDWGNEGDWVYGKYEH
ncbi:MAG: type II secretion system protein [Candidatus Paceibacterota bacterium]|jgi:prepilin-type N-terminal cleavage/methylation domain-containing protein